MKKIGRTLKETALATAPAPAPAPPPASISREFDPKALERMEQLASSIDRLKTEDIVR